MNHYKILKVNAQATAIEIKQAYRKLAKLYHPDTKEAETNGEEIIRINAAYEILSNPRSRRRYDQELQLGGNYESLSHRQKRTAKASQEYSRRRQASKKQEISYQQWLQTVYLPSDRYIQKILNPLESEIDNLSADPFDDELLEDFQAYLEDCRHYLQLAKQRFAAYPNPAQLAKVAASLYYCLNQIEDGIKELEYFVFNYDEHYIHTGKEIFRIAERLRSEAQEDMGFFF
ncbi:DnaJ-class molecular chaperone with C-terminal Zn finger domain [Hyella patelloides LEGE 07179]|uniref:DnaJ-class molecular chaperone with C-terminal Zn finger domain n=1 Tax=Hyella patelloides LEGE 07179 TaxID=945734 RepID=A0A563VP99_9CYAN|nr:DnaJ domain-containing protein [Hyella patelloides]VEP13199.1 DnaJ-class molecular chaperone with C-terminal Zn finger domain [Hyella patelloides LEGE 07179]